jgi:hypothetical protein
MGLLSLPETLQTSVTSGIPASIADYARGSPCAGAASLSHSSACSVPAAGVHTLTCWAFAIGFIISQHSRLRGRECIARLAELATPASIFTPCDCIRQLSVYKAGWLRMCSNIPCTMKSFPGLLPDLNRLIWTIRIVELLTALHKRLYLTATSRHPVSVGPDRWNRPSVLGKASVPALASTC